MSPVVIVSDFQSTMVNGFRVNENSSHCEYYYLHADCSAQVENILFIYLFCQLHNENPFAEMVSSENFYFQSIKFNCKNESHCSVSCRIIRKSVTVLLKQ